MTRPGRVIADRYRLDAPLGRGGMGEVWRGYDQRLERHTAVKLIRGEQAALFGDGEILVRRFVRECRALARIDHPGVVAIHDAGRDPDQHGGELFLVMQFIDGVRLADYIAENDPVPWPAAAALGAQIASVLAALHAIPVVHRDVKPANVMLRPDGTAVLLDLGIAGLLDPNASRLTRTGETLGSPAYTAPELALSGTSGPPGDLYALGCVLHETLSGETLFRAPTIYALFEKHAKEQPISVRSLRPDVPEALDAVILALLAKDPAGRPHAVDVYQALTALLPPGLDQPDRPHDPWRPFRRPMAPAPRLLTTRPSAQVAPAVPVPAAAPIVPPPAFDIGAALAQAEVYVGAGQYTQAADLMTAVLNAALAKYDPNSQAIKDLQAQHANILTLAGSQPRR